VNATPKQRGLRQPAEWSPHEAVWTAWPSHPDEWRGDLEPARRSVAAMCAAIHDAGRGERIELLVLDEAGERSAREHLGDTPASIHRLPYGDVWLRDTAPIFVTGADELAAVCCAFNGWGGKYLFPDDLPLRGRIAELVGRPRFEFSWILEGGAVDVDGEGTLLTTRECLLNPNRNPDMDAGAVEGALGDALGAERVLWLDRGLVNDHTDGHVDTLARFVAPGVVLCMEARDPGDPNRAVLHDILTSLRGTRDAAGRTLEVVTVPSPGRVEDPEGEVMPASYANFYIANTTVVVPTYRSRWDDPAVEAIAALFPDRRTVGVDALPILIGGGAFHCITQQQPRRP
jgi:agmatine deiminase